MPEPHDSRFTSHDNKSSTHHSPLTSHPSPLAILSQYWHYPNFRPMQEEIIESILAGRDTLALLPTGGGKSICYQVPALCKPGICLVISPLIALMKDQVEQLRKRGITAFALYSGMTRKEVEQTLKTASDSNCKFLYVSPERLETNLFKEWLASLDINLIAVDEAHCISQWGYDFRPPYLRIAELRESLPKIPILALTASATEAVQQDIVSKLSFTNPVVFRQSFARPNLSYSVFKVDSKINKIIEVLKKVQGSGLVYCKSRKRTKEISNLLAMHGISADFYHAGLSNESRAEKQGSWIMNKIRVMVCTNAFGMGIDKPDVRVVVHADVPDCLENYYQEAGRAGRDGKKSYAVLLYNEKELEDLKTQADTRFPELSTIRSIYQSVMNYLQLPLSSGEGNYYDFDIVSFTRKFKLKAPLVWSTLKVLEQEDLISYTDFAFTSSTVQFVTNKEILYEFESNHSDLEPIIKALLRNYEGIFDYPAKIHERTLAFLLKSEESMVKTQLKTLQSFRIIQYEPQKDSPQVFFHRNRVATEELTINIANHEKRKAEYLQRIKAILAYTKDTSSCRSIIIAEYFNDNTVTPCGVCDNCIDINSIKPEVFRKLSEQIYSILENKKLPLQQLIDAIPGVSSRRILKVIQFMQSENKIQVDTNGFLQLV